MTASTKWIALCMAVILIGAACASSMDAASTFRVVILPDTQRYTEQPPEGNRYSEQTQWIKNHTALDNTRFVIHLGDVVQDYDIASHWEIADAAHDILEAGPNSVPYSILPGNHDMHADQDDHTRNDAAYNNWFGPNRFEERSWYGGHYGSGNNNNYCYFTGAGMKFMVLSLEVIPTDDTLAWANNVLQANQDCRVIVATHWYLNEDGSRHDTEIPFERFLGNNGEDIWDKLIEGNKNIFMVVGGHRAGDVVRESTNDAGGVVYEKLTNFQEVSGHGDGWLQTLDFDAENDTIKVRSYSPTLDRYDLWAGEITLAYDMDVVPEPSSFVLLGSLVLLIGVFMLLMIWRRFVRRPAGGGLEQS